MGNVSMRGRVIALGLLFIISEGTKVEIGVEIGGFTYYLRQKAFFAGTSYEGVF